MGKSKFTEEIGKMLQDKKTRNLVVICLCAVFVLLALNVFQNSSVFKGNISSGSSGTSSEKNSTTNATEASSSKVMTEDEYESKQKTDLINILKKMNGVGDVDVMITFENGEEKVPAYNKNGQKTTTEETDNSGGKRVNNQNTDGSTVVMSSNNGKNEPFILKTYKPKIVGIVVVAEGAENSKTKYEIEQAVSKLYNLSLDKVNVYSMKN